MTRPWVLAPTLALQGPRWASSTPGTQLGMSGEAGSIVEICDAECVFLDKIPSRFNFVAHEFGK